jgi:hypothetical protein
MKMDILWEGDAMNGFNRGQHSLAGAGALVVSLSESKHYNYLFIIELLLCVGGVGGGRGSEKCVVV